MKNYTKGYAQHRQNQEHFVEKLMFTNLKKVKERVTLTSDQ